MSKTIQFSVHRNPLKDADGKVTFQVRHENFYTARRKDLMQHLQVHNTMNPEVMELALNVLATEIVDFLTDNKRLHLEGIGTFSLKVDSESVQMRTATYRNCSSPTLPTSLATMWP